MASNSARLFTAALMGVVLVLLTGAEPVAAAAPVGQFSWPLQPRPGVLRRFDKPAQNWLPGHRGVDLAGAPGQAVLAAGDGIVVFAGMVADKPVVSIDHPSGLRTTYEPVRDAVSVGRRVERGTRIGTLEAGHEGCETCLHWGLRSEGGRRRREYLDPLGLLHLTPLRLKPVAPP
ncbi:M23 family metallopeptidase [Nocardia sp. CA-128927]|uniref:M23 family metallopeptidase n=1 Tax=Nocardia sp. CA-128927 TaxID=3239975 RepID=UPI003D97F8F6